MTRTMDYQLDVCRFAPVIDTVDGRLSLVERIYGGPTLGTWLLSLWGISPGQSAPRGGLPTRPSAGSAAPWLYSI
jgi:hypothetical protein